MVQPSRKRSTTRPAQLWRRAISRVHAQQTVIQALRPEPSWKSLRPYVDSAVTGIILAPASHAFTSVLALANLPEYCLRVHPLMLPQDFRLGTWWWPLTWWRAFWALGRHMTKRGNRKKAVTSTVMLGAFQVLMHGRQTKVGYAIEAGTVRPRQPLWRCMLLESFFGVLGASLSLEYTRTNIGGTTAISWWLLFLGGVMGANRGVITATGGQSASVYWTCTAMEWVMCTMGLREEFIHLTGVPIGMGRWALTELFGIVYCAPWGLAHSLAERLLFRLFGRDPLVEQAEALRKVRVSLQVTLDAQKELASGRDRASRFFGSFEHASLWCRVRAARTAQSIVGLVSERVAPEPKRSSDALERQLQIVLSRVTKIRATELAKNFSTKEGKVSEQLVIRAVKAAMQPISVQRGKMVRSGLTQIAQRPSQQLLLGITIPCVPGLRHIVGVSSDAFGPHFEFRGEDARGPGVRRDFMDSLAEELLNPTEPGPTALRLLHQQRLELLCVGEDGTWHVAPCSEEMKGYLWALGRLLALALLFRSPCPIPFSLLVFKCILKITLRPGDVKQLDPDFWRHRIRPLLAVDGAKARQAELQRWDMDVLTFVSHDGTRELLPGGATVEVTDENKEKYTQLLCEDFLVGGVREEMGCIVQGFHEIIPSSALKHLDAEELRMLVGGSADLDVDEWEEHAVASGPEPLTSEIVSWFFGWLRRQSTEARAKMLAFATGSSVLPLGWGELKDGQGDPAPFRILVDGSDEALPWSHTCFNTLTLPPVATREALEEKLDCVLQNAGREMLIF